MANCWSYRGFDGRVYPAWNWANTYATNCRTPGVFSIRVNRPPLHHQCPTLPAIISQAADHPQTYRILDRKVGE